MMFSPLTLSPSSPTMPSQRIGSTTSSGSRSNSMLKLIILSAIAVQASAWGSSSDSGYDVSMYGNALERDWLYDSSGMSIQLEGCVWGYVDDNEESGCMEDSSEDGTSYWYQMANCRRAQAVFSVYASSSSHASCNNANFKETFVTKDGLPEFIYYLANFDSNSPFSSNSNNDDGDDDGGNYNDNFQNLPMCTTANGEYIGLGCSDDGTFSLQYFNDQYCLTPTGTTYDKLKELNRKLKNYKSCSQISSSGGLVQKLLSSSDSCSSLDSSYCTDSSNMKNMRSSSSSRLPRNGHFSGSKSWLTKLKYVSGGLLLLSSFVMFTGILFTNRRRRRALMQRKYRQRGKDGRSRKSKSATRSKSKSRDGSKTRSGSKSRDGSRSRRSKSRTPQDATAPDTTGVFT